MGVEGAAGGEAGERCVGGWHKPWAGGRQVVQTVGSGQEDGKPWEGVGETGELHGGGQEAGKPWEGVGEPGKPWGGGEKEGGKPLEGGVSRVSCRGAGRWEVMGGGRKEGPRGR